jgi:hypothetical protein
MGNRTTPAKDFEAVLHFGTFIHGRGERFHPYIAPVSMICDRA